LYVQVGINYSPHIRHAVFFRLMHRDQLALREQIAGDLWVLFDGVKEALGKDVGVLRSVQ
jgi:hypothetical protein